jgi:hypothetical protein
MVTSDDLQATRKEDAMRTAMMALLVVSAMAGLSTSADAQRGQRAQNQPTITQDAYNRCFRLAMARGQNTSNSDRYSLELFLDACLRGKIPF